MEPRQYLRIVQRRWRLLALAAALGAIFGLATALLGSAPAPATTQNVGIHTLLLDSTQGKRSEVAAILNRSAFLVRTGEVPNLVAQDIGGDPTRLARSVYVTPNATLRTVVIAAVDADPERAVQIADAFGQNVVDHLDNEAKREFDANLDAMNDEIDLLRAEFLRNEATLEGLLDGDAEGQLLEARNKALKAQITAQENQITDLTRSGAPRSGLKTLESARAVPITSAQLERLKDGDEITDISFGAVRADTSSESLSDNPVVRAVLGAILGLGGGVAVALSLSRYDTRLRTKEDAETALGMPVVAEIPPLPRSREYETSILSVDAPRSPTAEAYRALRASLVFLGSGGAVAAPNGSTTLVDPEQIARTPAEQRASREPRVIMVTSPGPSEGKTTSAANLAAMLGEADLNVLLVNCDFRKPRAHLFVGSENQPRKVLETTIPKVRLISDVVSNADRASPSEIVAAQRHLIRQARGLFDVIVLDTAPLLTTNDALDVLSEADLVVVVCRSGKTTREAAERTAELLERHGAPVAGAVLVGASEGPGYRYYYYYYGGYGYGYGGSYGSRYHRSKAYLAPNSERKKSSYLSSMPGGRYLSSKPGGRYLSSSGSKRRSGYFHSGRSGGATAVESDRAADDGESD